MGLQGPFPATLVIETAEEGERLLAACSMLKNHYRRRAPEGLASEEAADATEFKVLDALYSKVLMACGDD